MDCAQHVRHSPTRAVSANLVECYMQSACSQMFFTFHFSLFLGVPLIAKAFCARWRSGGRAEAPQGCSAKMKIMRRNRFAFHPTFCFGSSDRLIIIGLDQARRSLLTDVCAIAPVMREVRRTIP